MWGPQASVGPCWRLISGLINKHHETHTVPPCWALQREPSETGERWVVWKVLLQKTEYNFIIWPLGRLAWERPLKTWSHLHKHSLEHDKWLQVNTRTAADVANVSRLSDDGWVWNIKVLTHNFPLHLHRFLPCFKWLPAYDFSSFSADPGTDKAGAMIWFQQGPLGWEERCKEGVAQTRNMGLPSGPGKSPLHLHFSDCHVATNHRRFWHSRSGMGIEIPLF